MVSQPDVAARRSPLGPELSYILPMAVFLAFTQVAIWWPNAFAIVYPIKTLAAAALLVICWPAYTRVNFRAWPLGVLVGVIGIIEWVGLEKILLHFGYPRIHADVYDPMTSISSPGLRIAFIAFRWIGPTLVVPVMEELFWRDYLWRSIIAPNDFRLASVGEWDPKAFWIVIAFFGSVHIQWITAIVWGAMIGWLLLRTRSIGACMIAHGVTNFLLGAYVLWTHDWYFW